VLFRCELIISDLKRFITGDPSQSRNQRLCLCQNDSLPYDIMWTSEEPRWAPKMSW